MTAEEALTCIGAEVQACKKCDLYIGTRNGVPGEGSSHAEVMFIGEGPGYHEDRQGRPFVGPAGQFLNELLASIGLDRSSVYITNVVKHRPPDNRDPLPEEITACSDYLSRQIEAIQPKVIVTLGRYSMARFSGGEDQPDPRSGQGGGRAHRRGDVPSCGGAAPSGAETDGGDGLQASDPSGAGRGQAAHRGRQARRAGEVEGR